MPQEQEAERLYLIDAENSPLIPFKEQDKSVRDFYLKCAEAQPDLAGIREKLADKGFFPDELEYFEGSLLTHLRPKAIEKILNLTFNIGGGICPRCDGTKQIFTGEFPFYEGCPTCNGTGSLPERTITLKDFIRSQQDVKTASIKDELHQKEIEALIEEILEAINDEPEFPGNMPDEVWEAIQKAIDSNNSRAVIQDIMQNVVKMTKTEIIKRVALKATHSKE